ncbi:MAG: hypothetical protein JXA97_11255 [Anaerolineales bacterium]|nr:hypothetical protein [Anaerolineales bacterium]
MKKRRIGITTFMAKPSSACLIAGCSGQPVVPFEPTSLMDYHNGYWVTKINAPGFLFPVTAINDMHVDANTNRIMVYAQSRVSGRVIAPAQVGPG